MSPQMHENKDTISEHSMQDSGYQSRSEAHSEARSETQSMSSRYRAMNVEGHRMSPTQAVRNQATTQFFGNELSSPAMRPEETYFAPSQVMTHPQLPAAHMATAAGSGQPWPADNTQFQEQGFAEYSSYDEANMPTYFDQAQWSMSEAQFVNFEASLLPDSSNQTYAQGMYNEEHAQLQQTQCRAEADMALPARSQALGASPFTASRDPQQSLAYSATFGSLVMSPISMHNNVEGMHATGFAPDQANMESNIKIQPTTSNSPPAQSSNSEGDSLSQMDPTELSNLMEERNKMARSHAYYSHGPKGDGLYHCPWRSDATAHGDKPCNHQPTTLKCNYDKYLDSHLKPFICDRGKCNRVRFSSTACMLRHEREAHGMHGHGDRPHLCEYAGCERAAPGFGFPRRYNAIDHMKRVHGYQEPVTEKRRRASGPRKSTIRKGKAKGTAGGRVEKKTKVTKAKVQQQLQQKRAVMQDEFQASKLSMVQHLTELNIADFSEETRNMILDQVNVLYDVALAHDNSGKSVSGE